MVFVELQYLGAYLVETERHGFSLDEASWLNDLSLLGVLVSGVGSRSSKSFNTRATACHVSTCWLQWGWCRVLDGVESDVPASLVVWTTLLKESLSWSEKYCVQ